MACVKALDGLNLRKNKLEAKYDPANQSQHRERFNNKKPQADPKDTRTSAEKLADQVTPLWR